MGFFERNRESLEAKGYSAGSAPARAVLHRALSRCCTSATSRRSTRRRGRCGCSVSCAHERTLTWDDLHALPEVEIVTDIHCVTKWSKFDMRWNGVRFRDVLALVDVEPVGHPRAAARGVRLHDEHAARRPLADDVLLGGSSTASPSRPSTAVRCGWCCRLGTSGSRRSGCRGFEFLDHDEPGFWEQNGYHNDGDPWREQRYWGD